MIRHIRDVEAALGDGRKAGPHADEVEMYQKARRSLVAACPIPRGTRIAAEMLAIKRPGHGIKPKYRELVVGRVARVDIDEDDVLTWEML
jgi:sialic acid synthase SpsE